MPARSWPLFSLLAATVVATAWLLHIDGLGDLPFHSKGEAREALLVQDLLASERIALPLRNGTEMPRKPPLFHWLGAVAATARGAIDEYSVRLPSAVQSCVATLLILIIGAVHGQLRAGFFGAMILLTTLEWMRSATNARIDMTLALGTTAAFAGLSILDRYRGAGLCLLYGGMIWGTLAKGPIGIILPMLAMTALMLIDRGGRWIIAALAIATAMAVAQRAGAPSTVIAIAAIAAAAGIVSALGVVGVRRFAMHYGLPCVLAATGTWYALATRAGGREFVELQILAENFGRFFGTAQIEVGHHHGPGYLYGAFASGFLPWTLFVPAAARYLTHRQARPPMIQKALLWVVVVFGFFSLSSSQRTVYLLPLYPAASLVMGSWLADLSRAQADRLLSATGQFVGLTLALVGGAVALFFAVQSLDLPILEPTLEPLAEILGRDAIETLQRQLTRRAPYVATTAALLFAAALAMANRAAQQRWPAFIAATFATILPLLLLIQHGIMPAAAAIDTRAPFAATVEQVAGQRQLAMDRSLEYGFAYYSGGATPLIDLNRDDPGDALVVVPRYDWQHLPAPVRELYEVVPALTIRKQNNQGALITVQRAQR